MSQWKAVERAIAARLGGQRVPVPGRHNSEAPDIEHEWLAIEVKHRNNMPMWIAKAMKQAIASQKSEQQLPIVVLHEKNKPYDEANVVIRLSDFVDWFVS